MVAQILNFVPIISQHGKFPVPIFLLLEKNSWTIF